MKNSQDKQTPHETLQEKIKRLVREELALMMNEAENPVFKKLGGKDEAEFRKWILRQWFSDAKKGSSWYSPKVNEKNVLDYVSTNRSFPVTPVQLVTMWRDKKSLKSLLPAATKEIEQAQAQDDEERREYNKAGEVTHGQVGKELGVSGQAAAYFEQDGMNKFRQLYGGDPAKMEPEEIEALNAKIDEAREKTASLFAAALKSSGGDMAKFAGALHSKGLLPKAHAFSKEERQGLQYIAKQYKAAQIEQLLLADIEEDDNLFKSFQMAVARMVFPDKRRKAVG